MHFKRNYYLQVILLALIVLPILGKSQLNWVNIDTLFQPLPQGVHVYFTNDTLSGKPNIAYYISVPLKNRDLNFTTQVGNGKRYTPTAYFEMESKPLLVVNTTFFEFVHNRNLNAVIKEGKLLAYNTHSIVGRGKDTLTYRHPLGSVIGITKKRKADIAWLFTDSSARFPLASQAPVPDIKDSLQIFSYTQLPKTTTFKKWKMQTAVGGGPVLVQDGKVWVTNNEELKFGGKALYDKHPRTAMGYTGDGALIVMVVQGRFPGKAEGANLVQLGNMMADIGCKEALNLDGGGSSMMLINGKQTIQPSDKEGQRPVPAVFIIRSSNQ